MNFRRRFRPIGLRMIKSGIAVFICFLIQLIRGPYGIPFHSTSTALFCMQNDLGSSKSSAMLRIWGTIFGTVWGCLILLINIYLIKDVPVIYKYLLVSLAIIPVIYMTILLKRQDLAYFTCVVFLSISITYAIDSNPYIFIINRVLDMLIGIFVGIGINQFSLPRNYHNDILFVTGLDETLLKEEENQVSVYSQTELNRMIDRGALFTISTERTVSSLMDSIGDIHLKLPIIAFDGAVLFDAQEKSFLCKKAINREVVDKILSVCREEKVSCFNTVLLQDTLLIYYEELFHSTERELYKKWQTSLYRNYIQGTASPDAESIYIMCIGKREYITKLYHSIKRLPEADQIRMTRVLVKGCPGYVHLRIYHKNASKQEMLEELKKRMGIEKSVTFGTIPGKYDVLVKESGRNNVVNNIKKLYQPVKWARNKNKIGEHYEV